MKVGLVAPSILPIPAVLGGAIETLADNFISENESHSIHDLFIFSEYNRNARIISRSFKRAKFIWFDGSLTFKVINLIFRVLKKSGIIRTPFRVFLVSQYAKVYKLDVVVVEGNPVYVGFLKERFGSKKKIIFHIHALLSENDIHLIPALEKSDKVITVSNYIKSDIIERFKMAPGKIYVVHNSINNNFFKSKDPKPASGLLENKLKLDADDFILIFAGRLVPDKGLLELIKACKLLLSTIKLRLLILGSFGSGFGKNSERGNEFEKIIRKEISGFEENFLLLGFVPNKELPAYYKTAQLAVVPSLCNEAACLVAIEAMASALPVVFSGKGGIKEYVSSDCGIMIDMDKENCIEMLAMGIKKIHDNRSLYERMSEASFNRARLFTQKNYFKSLSATFD